MIGQINKYPGVQQYVHMLLSLLRMMQYCINHVEWCNNLTFCVISPYMTHAHQRTNGLTDWWPNGQTDKASYRDAWTHLKRRSKKRRRKRGKIVKIKKKNRKTENEKNGGKRRGVSRKMKTKNKTKQNKQHQLMKQIRDESVRRNAQSKIDRKRFP